MFIFPCIFFFFKNHECSDSWEFVLCLTDNQEPVGSSFHNAIAHAVQESVPVVEVCYLSFHWESATVKDIDYHGSCLLSARYNPSSIRPCSKSTWSPKCVWYSHQYTLCRGQRTSWRYKVTRCYQVLLCAPVPLQPFNWCHQTLGEGWPSTVSEGCVWLLSSRQLGPWWSWG